MSQDLRVLHVINGLATGGAEGVLYRLATYPSDIIHEVICLSGRASYSDKLERHGIEVHHLNWGSEGARAALSQLCRHIRTSKADVVQTWMYRSNLVGGVCGRMAGKPVIWNIRCSSLTPLRMASRALAYLGGLLAGWIPRFVVNCSSESAVLHARLGYEAAAGAVIPNGFNPDSFYPHEARRTNMRQSLGVESSTFLIGCIARWHPQKGFPVLFRAIRILLDQGVPVRLLLVGHGLELANPELANLISSEGCARSVEALGERSDIPEIARAVDLHVLASIGSEGFPNVVAETMLSGTPNVATQIGDAALIVGETGWIVRPGNAEQLAKSIESAYCELRAYPEQWRKRRDLARERIVTNFSLDGMARSYESLWRSIAAKVE